MVNEITVGGPPIIGYFALVSKATKTAQNQKSFLDIELTDRSGSIRCKMWDRDSIPPEIGDIVQVAATVGEYPPGSKRPQLTLTKIRRAKPEEFSMADMLPASDRPAEEMYTELVEIVTTYVSDLVLGYLLLTFLEQWREQLLVAPASKQFHHAFVGGLLEHILGIAKLAMATVVAYPELNSDVLIAGAVLHDIGKLKELSPTLGFKYTVHGRLYGHILQGFALVADWFDQYQVEQRMDEDLEANILHVIASHHGELEHGAAALPITQEAIIFHELDMIDSRMGAIRAAAKVPVDADGFTPFIPMFKAPLWRGTPCPQTQTQASEPMQPPPPAQMMDIPLFGDPMSEAKYPD